MGSFSASLAVNAREHCEILCPPGLNFRPGQYFLAAASGQLEALPTILFPYLKVGRRLVTARPIPNNWQTGTSLMLRGPLGRGFHVPAGMKRIALVESHPAGRPASILTHLMDEVLKRGGEVVFFGTHGAADLPTAVEGLPLEQAGEAWKWAEYLAADTDLSRLESLTRLLRPDADARLPDQAEVLIRANLFCGGQAVCGMCAVQTIHGAKLACKDGPVFPLRDLIGGRR